MAAFFAVAPYLDKKVPRVEAAIWVLRPHTLNLLESKSNYTHPIDSITSQRLLRPAFKDSGKESHKVIAVMAIEHDLRIFVQQGAFTIHSDNAPFDEREHHAEYLAKLTISSDCVGDFAKEMHACGFRRGDIYPDLTNLADEMKDNAVIDP